MSAVVVLLVAFLFSAYFSGVETVFTAFDRILIHGWARKGSLGARAARFLSRHPVRFLSTTLIGNNLSNVAYSSVLVVIAAAAGIPNPWVVALSPLFILVFGEIIPKTLGYALANRLVRWLSFSLLVFYGLFTPVRVLLHPLTRLLTRGKRVPSDLIGGDPFIMRRELDQILVGAEAEGAVTPEEGELLSRYLDARELKVRQIMTPRTSLVAVSADSAVDDVRAVFRRTRYNLLPVYEGDLDHVIGCVRAQEFLKSHKSVRQLVRPLHAVPESKRIVDLLQEFKSERRQAVLVIDEYGGTDGLVTIKDIFEELVGPVAERWDLHRPIIKRIAAGKFLVSGTASLENIAKVTGWSPPQRGAATLSGLLAEHLGRIALAGEEIVMDRVTLRVIRRNPRLVEGCLLKTPATADDETGAPA